MPEWGAFSFGVVLGWFLYYVNRYRKSEVGLGDLVTLLGAIGGGSVTALFGDAKTNLFGAYGVGLAVGFFAYFVTLIVLVSLSKGVFKLTWFLDGRRGKLGQGEEIPPDVGPTVRPMALPPGAPHAMALPVAPGASALAIASEQRDRAIAATSDLVRELQRRIGDATDDAERASLGQSQAELISRYDELVAMRLRDILDSEPVRSAMSKLAGITGELVATAQEMKSATDAVTTAAKAIDRVARVIALLSVFM